MSQSTNKNWIAITLSVLAVIVLLWAVIGFLPITNSLPEFDFSTDGEADPALYAQFGASFGWINSLFSAFAFAGVIILILMLRDDANKRTSAATDPEKSTSDSQLDANAHQEMQKHLLLSDYMKQLIALQQTNRWSSSNESSSFEKSRDIQEMATQYAMQQSLKISLESMKPFLLSQFPAMQELHKQGGKIWLIEQLQASSKKIKTELNCSRENKHERKLELVNKVDEQLQEIKKLNEYMKVDNAKFSKLFKVIKEAKDEHAERVVSRNIHISDLKEKIKFVSESLDGLIVNQMDEMQ